jgi:hypothetical protein
VAGRCSVESDGTDKLWGWANERPHDSNDSQIGRENPVTDSHEQTDRGHGISRIPGLTRKRVMHVWCTSMSSDNRKSLQMQGFSVAGL